MLPVVQVGGLADVVYGLSRELEIRGNAVEIILPMYETLRHDRIWGLSIAYNELWVPWYRRRRSLRRLFRICGRPQMLLHRAAFA